MAVYSLQHLADRLREKLQVPAVFNCVNTRLIIQTGVNLKKLSPDQDRDAALLNKVVVALSRMGVSLEDV